MKRLKEKFHKIVIFLQKYTKTDIKYLIKGGFWLTLGQVVFSGATFLLSIAFANLLDPFVYGNYKYILSLIGIMSVFSLPNLSKTLLTQAVARGFEGTIEKALKEKLKFGILGSLGLAIAGAYYFLKGNNVLSLPLFLSAVFFPLMQSYTIYGELLGGRKLFNIQVKYTTLNRILSIFAVLLAVVVTRNLGWLIFAYLFANTLLNFSFYYFIKKKFTPNEKVDFKTISFGKHLSFIEVLNTFASRLDKILIFHCLGGVSLAVYSFALSPILQLISIFKNIPILAVPKLASKSIKEIDESIKKRLIQLSLIGIATGTIYFFTAPFIFKIFYPKYLNAIPYSQFASLLIFLNLPVLFIGSLLHAKISYFPKKWLYFNSFPPLLFMIALMILVKNYQIWGVILAKMIFLMSFFILHFIRWKLIVKSYKSKGIE